MASKLPGAVWILRATGSMLKPFERLSHMLLKGGDILACAEDPGRLPVSAQFHRRLCGSRNAAALLWR